MWHHVLLLSQGLQKKSILLMATDHNHSACVLSALSVYLAVHFFLMYARPCSASILTVSSDILSYVASCVTSVSGSANTVISLCSIRLSGPTMFEGLYNLCVFICIFTNTHISILYSRSVPQTTLPSPQLTRVVQDFIAALRIFLVPLKPGRHHISRVWAMYNTYISGI